MRVIGVIPARWKSTRFPGKVLADLNGKSLIQHVWEQAKKVDLFADVIIACDEQHVFDAVEKFGAKAVMTSVEHESGTDRIAEAVTDIDVEIVVNIQGDEPLVDPKTLTDLAKSLMDHDDYVMSTVIKKIEQVDELDNPNVVKVVIDQNKKALYFSRCSIPYDRDKTGRNVFKHIGLYAYRKNFLDEFKNLAVSILEKTEKLEQLRVLESGYSIMTVETDQESIGVDTPEDLERVKELL